MSKPTETSLPLETAVGDLLRATGQLLRRLRVESNPRESTWSQTAILARLDEEGAMTTADLARAQSVKPQSMGAALAVLEQDGLVQRQSHPTDGRQVLFTVTEKGVAIRRRNSHLKREWLSAAMAKLTPAEQRSLVVAAVLIKRLSGS
jgi:DNA-binding MarR family transcriptional regulator